MYGVKNTSFISDILSALYENLMEKCALYLWAKNLSQKQWSWSLALEVLSAKSV